MKNKILPLLIPMALLCSRPALAFDPLKVIEQLSATVEVRETPTVRVKTAKILYLNYDLLKKDFDELKAKSNADIDEWVLEHCGRVAETQYDLGEKVGVNTHIEADSSRVTAYRPKSYGRGIVFKAGSGLIDAKGTGAINPAQGGHNNGLAPLGEMLREVLMADLVQQVFDHAGGDFDTVGHYGVIDLGFDIDAEMDRIPSNVWERIPDEIQAKMPKRLAEMLKKGPKVKTRAGIVLRQAHSRSDKGTSGFDVTGKANGQLDDASSAEIEQLLNKYGMSSGAANANNSDAFRGNYTMINIQGVNGARKKLNGGMVDFGAVTAVDHVTQKMYSYDQQGFIEKYTRMVKQEYGEATVENMEKFLAKNFKPARAQELRNQMAPLIDPTLPTYWQPVQELKIPFTVWGATHPFKGMSFVDNARIVSDLFVTKWKLGVAGRDDVLRLRKRMFEPVTRKLGGRAYPTKISSCWNDALTLVAKTIPIAATPYVMEEVSDPFTQQAEPVGTKQ